ncbi:hypothetical protein LEMLEM_LOCUS4426 [Lemmus lemmus]
MSDGEGPSADDLRFLPLCRGYGKLPHRAEEKEVGLPAQGQEQQAFVTVLSGTRGSTQAKSGVGALSFLAKPDL